MAGVQGFTRRIIITTFGIHRRLVMGRALAGWSIQENRKYYKRAKHLASRLLKEESDLLTEKEIKWLESISNRRSH